MMNILRVAGMARHLLTAGGGAAFVEGFTNGNDAIAIAGAVGTLAGFAWSFVAPEKKK